MDKKVVPTTIGILVGAIIVMAGVVYFHPPEQTNRQFRISRSSLPVKCMTMAEWTKRSHQMRHPGNGSVQQRTKMKFRDGKQVFIAGTQTSTAAKTFRDVEGIFLWIPDATIKGPKRRICIVAKGNMFK